MSDSDMHEATFLWPEVSPNEVILTGSFDQWSSSLRLTRTPGGFEGTVKLPWGERVLYKFIVDGHWKTIQSQPEEPDEAGNINNVYKCPSKPTLVQVDDTPSSHDVKPELDTADTVSLFAKLKFPQYEVENIETENIYIVDTMGSLTDASSHLRENGSQSAEDAVKTADPVTLVAGSIASADGPQGGMQATSLEPAVTFSVPALTVGALATPSTSIESEATASRVQEFFIQSDTEGFNSSPAYGSAIEKSSDTEIMSVTPLTEVPASVSPVIIDVKQKTLFPTILSSPSSEPTVTSDASLEGGVTAHEPEDIIVQPTTSSLEASDKNNGVIQPPPEDLIDVIPNATISMSDLPQPGRDEGRMTETSSTNITTNKFPQIEQSTQPSSPYEYPTGTGKFGSTRKKRVSIFGKVKNLFSHSEKEK